MAAGNLAVDLVMQMATIGVLGVGAQWVTRISTEYPIERFRHDRPEAVIVATLDDKARLKLVPDLEKLTSADGMRILHFSPPLTADPDRQGAPKDTILH